MTASDFNVMFGGVMVFITVLNVVYTILSARAKASKEELDAINNRINDAESQSNERINGHSNRLTAVEEQIKHLPSAAAMAMLTQQLSELHGDFREMLGEFKALKRQVSNIDEFLRDKNN